MPHYKLTWEAHTVVRNDPIGVTVDIPAGSLIFDPAGNANPEDVLARYKANGATASLEVITSEQYAAELRQRFQEGDRTLTRAQRAEAQGL
jgi:hypothetical protein